MKNGIAAFRFLTISQRFRSIAIDPEHVGKGAVYFPLVGLLLGSLLVMLDRVLQLYLGSEIASVVLVALLALITGAAHLDGLKETFDALIANSERAESEQKSEIVGLLAVVFVVVLKIRCLEVTDETRGLGLFLAPVFARWALVLFIYGMHGAVARTDRAARRIAEHVRKWQLICTTFITLVIAAFLIGRTALWIGLWVSLFTLISRTFLARTGALRYRHFGAVVELSETLTFVLFSTF